MQRSSFNAREAFELTIVPKTDRYEADDPRWLAQAAELSIMLSRLGIPLDQPSPAIGGKGVGHPWGR
jgi:hypothetical protein